MQYSLNSPNFAADFQKEDFELSSYFFIKTVGLNFKLFSVQRNSRYETRFSFKMGVLTTQVTYIKKTILGLPFKTLHKYRETYFGEVKDCKDCSIAKMTPSQ